MSTDQITSNKTTDRLAACWQALREGYRTANTVTHHALGALLKLGIVVYFIFCMLVLALRYLVLPNIDSYKPDVERLAARALGNKVTIADIDASWDGLRPRLALHDVVIHDKFGNAALHLPDVSATLSWWTVPAGDLRLHRLEIVRPDMDVRRDADGKLYVAGIYIDTGKSGNGKGADWVLSQNEIVIRDGRLHWNDYKRAAPELLLENVDLVLRNHWRTHRFALKATPPAAFAAPVDVRAAFEHPGFAARISDPALWKGELYADLRDTDLTVWKAYIDYPFEMQQGKGSVRAWLDFDHARVANFTSDLSLSNVSAKLRPDLPTMNLVDVAGRVSVREELNPNRADGKPTLGMNGHAISLTDFSLRTDDGLFLPKTTISESFTPARRGKPEKTEIKAKLLDLQTLASFVERLPLPAEQRRMLTDFAPRGTLKDFSAQWQGAYPAISSYSVKGQFASLSLNAQEARAARAKSGKTPAQAAVPAIPGFDNLTGQIDANDRGGSISLASANLKLQLPGYFADPVMPLDRLLMQATWAFQGKDQLLVDVQKMDFVQDALSGSFSGKHMMSLNAQSGKPNGTIDVSGKLNGLELQNVGRYLPLQTPQGLRDWLRGALVGGTAHDLKLKLKGDLAQFPFQHQTAGDRPRGEFSVAGRIEGGRLNYTPGSFAKDGKAPMWPLLEEIRGTIAFDRTRMEINAHSAKTAGVSLSNVKAVIPDLASPDMLLAIDGDAEGALQNFVQFTKDSPVADWIGQFTDETRANGNARLDLKLQMPLAHMPDTKVKGTLQFAGNNVTLRNMIPPLLSANGKLEFNEKGFNLNGIKANFLGGPVTITGGTQRDGNIVVKADGMLSAEGVRRNYGVQRASERISGSTRYSTLIRVRNAQPDITVESNLVGIALDFPAPLRKAAGESLPLRFELTGLPSNNPAVARDDMKLSLGNSIVARYERQKTADKDADWRVVRGGIGVNVPAPQPDAGVVANVNLKSLDVDAWRRAMTAVVASDRSKEQQSGPSISQYIEPGVLAARAGELVVMNKKLDNVVVGASHQKGVWQANIDSDQASGYLTWNEAQAGQGLGKVTARLASLIIPEAAASDVTDLLEGKNASTQIPEVDIVAENFELFGKKFGHLEVAASDAGGPAGREWRVNKLSLVNADAEFRATGKWILRGGENVSSLVYTLNIGDAGRLLDRFGFANVLRGGKGKMEGDVSWKGLPFSLDIPSLSGQLTLNMASGQFLKVDPAAAKLLGVLSLQSLPRRLALDFRDVFSQGFAFDGITASASITHGVAKTDNFKMRGVAATVLIDGSADIAKEAQNLHVVVIPEINVGTASVVYGLAVNPVIGVGSFLAQLFLRDPLMKAFTFEYQITGPWKDPVVTKLLRKPAVAPASEASNNLETSG
ncbi:YhdP family protein [Noviherbaspirillum sp. UKPF54]|uniref:YhdP family protein n=1 Tax=Noviherbaspirillum sp. UKPF54 TaxID=2601898 RepID=UPI0011B0F88C|nr:YhdP family protein [Noviherbaspirillum sp. UKPF54]QDZ28484.1 TIGR02099 family protein [Noviherbaspirillum sp. UKPF54]